MRKMALIILITLTTKILLAPGLAELIIVNEAPCYRFDPMLDAFKFIESNFRTDIVNRLGYTGILQLGQEMIDEANRICELTGNPRRFTFPKSALDPIEAVQIWYIVQDYWNPKYDLKKACKIWNPLASKKYYEKIHKRMEIKKLL